MDSLRGESNIHDGVMGKDEGVFSDVEIGGSGSMVGQNFHEGGYLRGNVRNVIDHPNCMSEELKDFSLSKLVQTPLKYVHEPGQGRV